jgi:hypothetical protein
VPLFGTQKTIGAMTRPREGITNLWFLANPLIGSRHGRIETIEKPAAAANQVWWF